MRTVVEAAGSYLVRWREARRSVRLSWIFSRDGRWTQNGLCPKRQFRLRLTKGGGRGGGRLVAGLRSAAKSGGEGVPPPGRPFLQTQGGFGCPSAKNFSCHFAL